MICCCWLAKQINPGKIAALAVVFFTQFFGITVLSQSKNGWTDLIKNNSLQGWKKLCGGGLFGIENGAITGISVVDSVNTFLVTEREYGDFILELDVKIESELSNSGIQTRSHFGGDQHPGKVYGRQVEIDPSSRQWTGGIYDEERREWLYPLTFNVSAKEAFIVGKYNHVKIECIGNEMKTWINQVPAAYLKDTLDRTGFIGLQVHAAGDVEKPGTKVYFKNIRIKTSGLVAEKMPAQMQVVDTRKVPGKL
jgi:hypothetical protein